MGEREGGREGDKRAEGVREGERGRKKPYMYVHDYSGTCTCI